MNLTQNEQVIYEALVSAANACAPCPSNERLNEIIGCDLDSEPPRILSRLEIKGMIERETFQRSRRIGIKASGKWTAMPLNTAPHWRNRPKDVPTPSVVSMRTRHPDITAQIMTWAATRGVPICDAIADLVYVGWKVEQERG